MSSYIINVKNEDNINSQFVTKDKIASNSSIAGAIKTNIDTKETISSDTKTINNVNGTLLNTNNLSGSFNTGNPTPQYGYGYLHIKYSHKKPTTNEEVLDIPDDDTWYIGVYSDNSPYDSIEYTRYTWMLFRGKDGEEGEKGETGEKGEKGDSGETTLIVINPLYFEGYLNVENWQRDSTSRDATFYYQKIEVTDLTLVTSTMTQEELIAYMNIKMTDKVTPVIDLIVSDSNVTLGLSQMEEWKNLSRVYISKEELFDNQFRYFMNFECYKKAPNVQLKYQVKVI